LSPGESPIKIKDDDALSKEDDSFILDNSLDQPNNFCSNSFSQDLSESYENSLSSSFNDMNDMNDMNDSDTDPMNKEAFLFD